jgi:transposase-like protein
MVNIRDLIDEAKRYDTVRSMRWPEGVACPYCSVAAITKDGRDDIHRYLCHDCRWRFDDLTGTIFAGHHEPLQIGIIGLYFMGLNLATLQMAKKLDMYRDDVRGDGPATPTGDPRSAASRRPLPRGRVRRRRSSGRTYGEPPGGEKRGRLGRRRRLKGERGRGTLE